MQRFFSHYLSGTPALGLLVLRVVFGSALMLHGWSKIQSPFQWMDKPGAPSSVPGFMQALAALGEFAGGAGLVLGFLTPVACLGVLCTMMGAWFIAHRNDPWVNPGGKSFELASLYFAIAFALLFTGPGRFSLDALIWNRSKR